MPKEEAFTKGSIPKTKKYTKKGIPKTTLKGGKTTQKLPPKEEKTTPKRLGKTAQLIIDMMIADPTTTREQFAQAVNVSIDAIKWQIKNLMSRGIVTRIGANRGGFWKVQNPNKKEQEPSDKFGVDTREICRPLIFLLPVSQTATPVRMISAFHGKHVVHQMPSRMSQAAYEKVLCMTAPPSWGCSIFAGKSKTYRLACE